MSNLIVLYQNYGDTADYSGGSWLSSFPLTNAKDDDVGVVARSTNALNASTKFTVNFGTARDVGAVAIGPCNASPGSSFRIRAYSDSDLTVLVDDSEVKAVAGTTIDWSDTGQWLAWEDFFWEGVPDLLDQDDAPVWLVYIPDDDIPAQYWLVEIFDEANSDGYVQFGRVVIGRAFRPSVNYAPDNNSFDPNIPIGDVSETLGGKRNYWSRGKRRAARFGFELLHEDELFGDVYRMGRLSMGSQVFLVPDPADASNLQKRSFLATLKMAPPIVQAAVPEHGTTMLDAEEVV